MSKKELKNYLKTLSKTQLEEQLIDLYERFKPIKTYYDFIFNPKEEKLIHECKVKISNEYFPSGKRKRPKMRRSVAQKFIKHFLTIGMDAMLISDVMLYNIEVAQTFTADKTVKQVAFFKSMYNSYKQAVVFIAENQQLSFYHTRLQKITEKAIAQDWENAYEFEKTLTQIS